jgi:hypothetical protein
MSRASFQPWPAARAGRAGSLEQGAQHMQQREPQRVHRLPVQPKAPYAPADGADIARRWQCCSTCAPSARPTDTDNRWSGGVAAITLTITTTTTRRMAMGSSLCSAPCQRRIAASPHRRIAVHSSTLPRQSSPNTRVPEFPGLLLRPVCTRFRRAHVTHGTLIAQPRR